MDKCKHGDRNKTSPSANERGFGDTSKERVALPEGVRAALALALADERLAQKTYTSILARLGPVRPFSNIVEAESRHIKAIESIYRSYHEPLPPDETTVDPSIKTQVFAELCSTAAKAEIENVRLYDAQLLPAVADFPDILAVFVRLRDASAFRHLPAFQRHAG